MHISNHLPWQGGHCTRWASPADTTAPPDVTDTTAPAPDAAPTEQVDATDAGRCGGGKPDRCGEDGDRHDRGRHNGWSRRDEAWAAKYERFLDRRERAIERVEERGARKLNDAIDQRVGELLNRDDLTDEQRTAIAMASADFDAAMADGSTKSADAANALLDALGAALNPPPAPPVEPETPGTPDTPDTPTVPTDSTDPTTPAVDTPDTTTDTPVAPTDSTDTPSTEPTDPTTPTDSTDPTTPTDTPTVPAESDEPSLADLLGSLREAVERILDRTERKVDSLSAPRLCGCAWSKFHDAYMRLRGDEPEQPADPPTDPVTPTDTAEPDAPADTTSPTTVDIAA